MKTRLGFAAILFFLCSVPLRAATPSTSRSAKPLAWDSDTYAYLYDYDGAGNVIKAGDDQYRYDAFGRLVYGTAKTAAFTDNLQTFSYDRFGNLLKVTTTSGGQSSVDGFAVDADRNQLSNVVPCPPGSTTCHLGAYDAEGNRTGTVTGVTEYQWDAAGMMTELNLASRHEEYVYDANDERIAVVDRPGNTARYTLRGADKKVLREMSHDPLSGTWSWSRDYVYRDGILLAEYLAAEPGPGPQRHYHVDHLGTPRLITDAGGYKVSLHTYWPFGAEARGSERDTERMKFTGHERDANPGAPGQELDYMHARYYGGIEGRFLSVDPTWSSSALSQPQTWNRYSYVLNNPVRYTDPDGRCTNVLDCTLEGGAVAGPTGAVVGAAVGVGIVYVGSKVNWRAVGEFLLSGGGGGPEPAAEAYVQNMANHMAEQQEQASGETGTIYEVPGEATSSGRPYVGRHNQPEPNKTRRSNDGRDRTKAKVVDTYDANNKQEGRVKEQKAIDDRGGVKNLDNKRNEIAPKKNEPTVTPCTPKSVC